MRASRKLIVLGIALAGAAPFLVAGCYSDRNEPQARPASTSLGTEIDDTVVTARVKSALFADPAVKSFDLKVETRKGRVQLSGFVDSPAQVKHALGTARAVEGVTSVENGLGLKNGGTTLGNTVDDGVITTRVKSALLADPSIKSFDIAVATRSGAVQLSGYVDSQVQIDQAIALTRKVDGVNRVDTEMSIKK